MPRIVLQSLNDFAEWRDIARRLAGAAVEPHDVVWSEPGGAGDLFADPDPVPQPRASRALSVPKTFPARAQSAICHADPSRFALLYRLLWRLQDNPKLLDVASDPDCIALVALEKAVRRDSHKMKAFVRFRQAGHHGEAERFAAWFEPDHYTLERTAPFFARRFPAMHWAILTPYRSVAFDTQNLVFGPGAERADVPADDAMEDAWRTYFASIFNPARLKVSAMTSEMPKKYWRNLPEAELIDDLIRSARTREDIMVASKGTQVPARHARQAARKPAPADPSEQFETLKQARVAIDGCRRCPLYENATQPVFGEGPEDARIMFVGEQPGDNEDLAGKPFIGPAGQMFDAAIEIAGIERNKVYVTNAVKHFKFVPRGKRRLHQKPNGGEISACRFWLDHERALIKPEIVVALGASAAQSLLGKPVTLSRLRGEPIALADGLTLFVTVHPSYLLRIPDRERAEAERKAFIADLVSVARFAQNLQPPTPPLDSTPTAA